MDGGRNFASNRGIEQIYLTDYRGTNNSTRDFTSTLYRPEHATGEWPQMRQPTFVTEAGRTIRGDHWSLYRDDNTQNAPIYEVMQFLQDEGLAGKVHPLTASDRRYNCHSYTFTQGAAGWIGHDQVNNILYDQKYIQCSRQGAQVGDIVIYRNAEGFVKHSGVISQKEGKNLSIVSKWGDLPLMEHGIDDVLDRFGPHKGIYHSELVETSLLKTI